MDAVQIPKTIWLVRGGLKSSQDLIFLIRIEGEDGGKIAAGGFGQGEAVLLGPGEGLLVWPDRTGAGGLELYAAKEGSSGVGG